VAVQPVDESCTALGATADRPSGIASSAIPSRVVTPSVFNPPLLTEACWITFGCAGMRPASDVEDRERVASREPVEKCILKISEEED